MTECCSHNTPKEHQRFLHLSDGLVSDGHEAGESIADASFRGGHILR
eukprot:CAMPEP_0198131120 /NCGR_PEP_ID=MMETSP1442-20131203/55424_1 /TAXON_ID= /ORGANISM="Craspedostauros australis, Strain CCMP3328" /LENGTH=46 /DNA_ID= /DNA_START= /DNA_END= /DNA_ORIENTATION=